MQRSYWAWRYFCTLWWRQSRKPTQDCHLEHSSHLSDRFQAPRQNHEPQPVAIQIPHGEMPGKNRRFFAFLNKTAYAVLFRKASCSTMCFDWPHIALEIEARTFVPSDKDTDCAVIPSEFWRKSTGNEVGTLSPNQQATTLDKGPSSQLTRQRLWAKVPVPKSPGNIYGQRCNTRHVVEKTILNLTLAFIIISKVKITVSTSIVASIIWRF